MSFSNRNPALTLERLCGDAEGQFLERKGRESKATKVANELIGMLNAGGGVLVVGINDAGQVEDLNALSGARLDALRKIVQDMIKPPANLELEEILLEDGSLIFVYHVDQDYERLFQRTDNEDVFLRVAESNRGPLNREQVRQLEYDRTIRQFEDEAREDFDPADLDSGLCDEYRRLMRYEGPFADLAVKRNLAVRRDGRVVFKNAAVLLFAQDPSQYIPNAAVRYVRYAGTTQQSGREFNVVKDERFEANIPQLIRRVEAFLQATLRDYYFLNMESGRFERVPEFPKEAWLEGIVNALCHRSYNLQGNTIYIRHFDDRLEVANSGPLPAQVTVENITRERYARNPRIARVLAEMGFVRELNEGVPRIYSAMRQSMLAEPEYADRENTVTLTLRNKVTEHKDTIPAATLRQIEQAWGELNPTQRSLIGLLFEEREATVPRMVEWVELTEQAVRYNLKKLEALHITERLSEKQRDPSARYRLLNG